jgi:GGDEF domain-containing protein
MSKQAALSGEDAASSLAILLLPLITHNGHLRGSIVLLQVDWHHHEGDWAGLRKEIMELLTRSIRAGGDLLLPTVGREERRESFFILASTDLEHAQLMLRRIRERLAGLPDLAASGTVTVSAKSIWLPTRSGDSSLEELAAAVAERITRSAKSAD